MQRKFHTILLCLLVCSATLGGASAGSAASCEPRNLGFGQKSVNWTHQPLSKLKRDTVYTLVNEAGRNVLRGVAKGSASLYVAAIKPPVAVPEALSWRWKTDALVPGADNRDKAREDAPLRVLAAFDGNISKLPEVEQQRFRRARNLSGRDIPYAVLMYIWSEQVAVESVIPSAHTSWPRRGRADGGGVTTNAAGRRTRRTTTTGRTAAPPGGGARRATRHRPM